MVSEDIQDLAPLTSQVLLSLPLFSIFLFLSQSYLLVIFYALRSFVAHILHNLLDLYGITAPPP